MMEAVNIALIKIMHSINLVSLNIVAKIIHNFLASHDIPNHIQRIFHRAKGSKIRKHPPTGLERVDTSDTPIKNIPLPTGKAIAFRRPRRTPSPLCKIGTINDSPSGFSSFSVKSVNDRLKCPDFDRINGYLLTWFLLQSSALAGSSLTTVPLCVFPLIDNSPPWYWLSLSDVTTDLE